MSEVDLLILSNRAAVELDKASRGKPVEFRAARLLGQQLQRSTKLDYLMRNLCFHALVKSQGGQPSNEGLTAIRNPSEQDLVGELVKVTPEVPAKKQKCLRDFCVAFATQLLSNHYSMRRYQPPNPHRK